MGAQQRELLGAVSGGDDAGHRRVQRVNRRERPAAPGALGDPPRMLEHPADGVEKLAAAAAIQLCQRQERLPAAPTAGCGAAVSARRTAKKIRSGVAGLSNVTGPPPPNAATASRSASRTEIASINGGSPTALLPMTTPG